MPITPSRRALDAYRTFVETDLDALLAARAGRDPAENALALFRRAAAEVPAYGEFLRERGVDPGAVRGPDDFGRLPLVTKADYVRRYPLPARCRGGRLAAADMAAVSSGSTGEPTFWPRALPDELAVAWRFEQ
ncbi:MAG TPA: phenylacetate--CoA ligase family protein, partial [Polyangiaceae bacterium]|nr:phenylacetate--CoA ligase family protein [Polyangiaceae bacterium]